LLTFERSSAGAGGSGKRIAPTTSGGSSTRASASAGQTAFALNAEVAHRRGQPTDDASVAFAGLLAELDVRAVVTEAEGERGGVDYGETGIAEQPEREHRSWLGKDIVARWSIDEGGQA
jgi:hypothetical protein